MLIFFFVFSLSDTVENRVFIQNNGNFTGAWEISGDSGFIGEDFYLVPEKSRSIGGIFYTTPLPESFSAEINMTFEGPTNENPCNLGIWITKDYHQNPIVFGGPLSFEGVALMMVYNGSVLNTEFRKNDRHGRYISYQYFPTSFEEIYENRLQFRIENREGSNVSVFIRTGQKEKMIFNEIPLSSIKKYFLSVTTKNGKHPNVIKVQSALVSNDPDSDLKPIVAKKVNMIKQTKKESGKKGENRNNEKQIISSHATVDDVLDQILEFDLFSQEITKMADIRGLIQKEMLPFSDRWQRRSIRLMRETVGLRENLSNTLNNSHALLEKVKQDLEDNIVELMKSYKEVESELYYGISNSYDLHNEIKEEKKKGLHSISEILLYVGIGELILIISAFLVKWISDTFINQE